ncbi:hypothetical protein BDV59DRAFT_170884 [Aspergillus ambiguus]|uniref:uncharacterized protein n=1 Tax=Aspergillus ambiguus TaxID=176160 RepID=UPI003CCDE987
MESDDSCVVAPPTWRKRIPKACASCRQSKVKCDGKRPCTRCEKLKRRCVFFEIPKDATTERFESVESEVRQLREQLDDLNGLLRLNTQTNVDSLGPALAPSPLSLPVQQPCSVPSPGQMVSAPPGIPAYLGPASVELAGSQRNLLSQNNLSENKSARSGKRKRSGFEVRCDPISDFITEGLMTMEYAMSCFRTYFRVAIGTFPYSTLDMTHFSLCVLAAASY